MFTLRGTGVAFLKAWKILSLPSQNTHTSVLLMWRKRKKTSLYVLLQLASCCWGEASCIGKAPCLLALDRYIRTIQHHRWSQTNKELYLPLTPLLQPSGFPTSLTQRWGDHPTARFRWLIRHTMAGGVSRERRKKGVGPVGPTVSCHCKGNT